MIDMSWLFPKRSECRCACHSNPDIKHCVPCCYPDELENETLINKDDSDS